jgi:hypothetical protein
VDYHKKYSYVVVKDEQERREQKGMVNNTNLDRHPEILSQAPHVSDLFGASGMEWCGRIYHGRIIKTGNNWLRWAVIEAVPHAIRSEPELYAYADAKASGSFKRLGDRDRKLLCGGFASTDRRMIQRKNKVKEELRGKGSI